MRTTELSRTYGLLKALSMRAKFKLPKGVGRKTIERCIREGWIEEISQNISTSKAEFSGLRITAEGKIEYLYLTERVTGKTPKALYAYRMVALKNMVGRSAFNALKKKKAVLKIWRRTTPFNQWIESTAGTILWHSDDRDMNQRLGGLIRMFRLKSISANIINVSTHFSIPGNGNPELSIYTLKQGYIATI